jgi:hypothetical protein
MVATHRPLVVSTGDVRKLSGNVLSADSLGWARMASDDLGLRRGGTEAIRGWEERRSEAIRAYLDLSTLRDWW